MAKAKKGKPRGDGNPGVTRSDLEPSQSRIIRAVQAAYMDAGKPLADTLAKKAKVSGETLRQALLHGKCPTSIAWLERVVDALGMQVVLLPKRPRSSPADHGGSPTLDND